MDLERQLERRIPLGTLPTPIVRCRPAGALFEGIELDLKRDDLIGDVLTGTKMRALSHIVWQAREDGVTDLITIGEPTSNQCRLVAVLGARHGMPCHVLLRESARLPQPTDNVQIMDLHGAQLQWLDEDEWRLHGMAVKRLMSRMRKAGRKALFVPFGCGGLPGALGIIDLARELLAQHGGQLPYDHVFVPTGSGATLFALDLAMQLLDVPPDARPALRGVSVSRDAAGLLTQIDRLYAKTSAALGRPLSRSEALHVDDRWRDGSPAMHLEQLQRVSTVYRFTPDPHYVLPTFLALERGLEEGELRAPARVLVLISGACRTLDALRQRAMNERS